MLFKLWSDGYLHMEVNSCHILHVRTQINIMLKLRYFGNTKTTQKVLNALLSKDQIFFFFFNFNMSCAYWDFFGEVIILTNLD